MQPNPQFVEPLIALKRYYQSLLDQGYRELADARHQLTDHANTLLFDQNVEDQALVKSLIAMRQQWRELNEDCSSQIDHAREQLTHVNALLADQMVIQLPRDRFCNKVEKPKLEDLWGITNKLDVKGCPQYSEKLLPSLPVSMEARAVNNENLGLTGTPDIKSDFSAKEPDERGILINRTNREVKLWDRELEPDTTQLSDESQQITQEADALYPCRQNSCTDSTPLLVSETLTPMRVRPIYTDNVVDGAAHSLDLDEASKASSASVSSVPAPIVTVQPEPEFNLSLADEPDPSEPPTALTTVAPLVQPDPITKSDARAKGQASNKQLLTLTVPPNLQAVQNLLSSKAGAILHRDYLLRGLCGELDPSDLEVETATLSEILTIGVNQGLWAEVPGEKDCYTLDLRLVDPELAAKARLEEQSGKPPKSLPRRKLALQPLPNYQHLSLTDAIERVLMENAPQPLNIDTVTQKLFGSIESTARKSVGDLLVKGVIKGRWQRVPGRGAARYAIRLKSQPGNRD